MMGLKRDTSGFGTPAIEEETTKEETNLTANKSRFNAPELGVRSVKIADLMFKHDKDF